jgi:hypothetical protein
MLKEMRGGTRRLAVGVPTLAEEGVEREKGGAEVRRWRKKVENAAWVMGQAGEKKWEMESSWEEQKGQGGTLSRGR